ncbi:MAG TPA: flavodoxin domain-containing protein [Bacillota bacterium]|nr:flavodoxin domain-containing protein [Bacillota bacterium]
MKTLVVYKSKSGFTKTYAQWLAAELAADLMEAAKVNEDVLAAYDRIIYGGGLYAGGINGKKLITKNLDRLKGKKVVVFATGASPSRPEIVDEVQKRNFTAEQLQQLRFFYLRGGFDFGKLNSVDKLLMKMLKGQLQKKPQLTDDERGMLDAYDHPVDFCRKEDIAEIIQYLNS